RPLVTVTLISWLASGIVSWLLGGTGTVHIGASGIVFGYIIYVIVRGFFSRRFLHLLVGVLIGVFYGLDAVAAVSPRAAAGCGGGRSVASSRRTDSSATVRLSSSPPGGSRDARPAVRAADAPGPGRADRGLRFRGGWSDGGARDHGPAAGRVGGLHRRHRPRAV